LSADIELVKRAMLFGVTAALAVALFVVIVGPRERNPITFAVEPGTERTFAAEDLIPGDRFSCHGFIVPRQGSGYGALASDGTYAESDTRGNVTVRCPEHLEPI
jgi:hypothetical protein